MPPKAVTSQHKGRVKVKHKQQDRKEVKTMAKKLTVYEDYMLQLMTMFQNHIDGVKIRNDVFSEEVEWERLNNMQAWYTTIGDVEFLKSYDTIVAIYDGKDLYVRGKTTIISLFCFSSRQRYEKPTTKQNGECPKIFMDTLLQREKRVNLWLFRTVTPSQGAQL